VFLSIPISAIAAVIGAFIRGGSNQLDGDGGLAIVFSALIDTRYRAENIFAIWKWRIAGRCGGKRAARKGASGAKYDYANALWSWRIRRSARNLGGEKSAGQRS